jgi:hypothetical protein|tara:strand:- start:116 stop:385 length:270 start_codon:yes stop_codon:yes gene_type:complete
MTNETIFIAANNGGLEIYKGVGNLIAGNIKTAKTFKYVMDTHGIDPDVDTIYTTSDMDFADECGFDHYDDARILMEEGLKFMEMTKEYK